MHLCFLQWLHFLHLPSSSLSKLFCIPQNIILELQSPDLPGNTWSHLCECSPLDSLVASAESPVFICPHVSQNIQFLEDRDPL
jgi:hypothetical protein